MRQQILMAQVAEQKYQLSIMGEVIQKQAQGIPLKDGEVWQAMNCNASLNRSRANRFSRQ